MNDQKDKPLKDVKDSIQKTNVLSIIGLIAAFVFWPVGLLCSLIALVQIKVKKEGGRSLAIGGLITSLCLGLATLFFLVIFWSIFATFFGFQERMMDDFMHSHCSVTSDPPGAIIYTQDFHRRTVDIGRTPTKVPRPWPDNEPITLKMHGYHDAREYLLSKSVGGDCRIHVNLRRF